VKRAVIVAIALSAVACVAPGPPSASPPSPPMPAAPSPNIADAEWHRVELPDGGGAFLAAVAATERETVVVGAAGQNAKAWSSREAGSWSAESVPARAGNPGAAERLDDRIIVTASDQTDRCAHPGELAFWARELDSPWRVAPFNPAFCVGGASGVATADGRAAVFGLGTGDIAYAWFSNDGLSWVPTPVRRDINPALVVGLARGFVAVGTFLDTNGEWWFARSDGRSGWTIVPFFDPWAESLAVGIASGGRGLLAWFQNPGALLTFTSATGETWESVEMSGLTGVDVTRIRQFSDVYVALGRVKDVPAIFVSRNGIDWARIPSPPDAAAFTAAAVSDRSAIVLGNVVTGPDMDVTAVWSGPASLVRH
jgi:hypothetical protein